MLHPVLGLLRFPVFQRIEFLCLFRHARQIVRVNQANKQPGTDSADFFRRVAQHGADFPVDIDITLFRQIVNIKQIRQRIRNLPEDAPLL